MKGRKIMRIVTDRLKRKKDFDPLLHHFLITSDGIVEGMPIVLYSPKGDDGAIVVALYKADEDQPLLDNPYYRELLQKFNIVIDEMDIDTE